MVLNCLSPMEKPCSVLSYYWRLAAAGLLPLDNSPSHSVTVWKLPSLPSLPFTSKRHGCVNSRAFRSVPRKFPCLLRACVRRAHCSSPIGDSVDRRFCERPPGARAHCTSLITDSRCRLTGFL